MQRVIQDMAKSLVEGIKERNQVMSLLSLDDKTPEFSPERTGVQSPYEVVGPTQGNAPS